MAATAADGNKVEEVVGEKNNIGEVVVGEKSKMITLMSSDGERFEITHEAAAMSQTIHHMIEDDCVGNDVPLPNLPSGILSKVIEYCNQHVATSSDNGGAAASEQDLKSFDESFMKMDQATLFDIILAANYLDIKGLMDLSCQTVADMIKGKSVEEIRKTFHIKNDFTPEEEEDIRKENQWAFE